MSPSYTQKRNGVRYRYYVSQAHIKGRSREAGSISRVPAQAIEELVAERVMNITEGDSWDGLSPKDQGERVRSLIQRVEIHSGEVKITLNQEMSIDKENSLIQIPLQLVKRGSEKIILPPNGNDQGYRTHSDRALIKAIARALSWREELESGKVKSVSELAQKAKCSKRYIHRLIKLAFLAPDITDAILRGGQPLHLTLARLLEMDLPLSWSIQCQKLGVYQKQSP